MIWPAIAVNIKQYAMHSNIYYTYMPIKEEITIQDWDLFLYWAPKRDVYLDRKPPERS
jgi:hypothetical protein